MDAIFTITLESDADHSIIRSEGTPLDKWIPWAHRIAELLIASTKTVMMMAGGVDLNTNDTRH
jgi:hypothetical protein